MRRALRIAGLVWLCLAGTLIVAAALEVMAKRGFAAFTEVFNPFNVTNALLVIASLAPGISLLLWSERFARPRQ